MRLPMAAVFALILAGPLHAGVEVTAARGRLDVTAAQAPVSDVLDGLARKTRMKVVYEGPAPRMPVTVELRDRTPAQAVLGVLEGLGLNYALLLDVSGTEVETLMIVGAGGPSLSASRPSSAASARVDARSARKEVLQAPDDPTLEGEDPPEVEASITSVPEEVPKVDEKETAPPAPAQLRPLNPTGPYPTFPFIPGMPQLVTPPPSPNPPSI